MIGKRKKKEITLVNLMALLNILDTIHIFLGVPLFLSTLTSLLRESYTCTSNSYD